MERLVRFYFWSQIGGGSFANGYADLTIRGQLTRKFIDGEIRDVLRKEYGQPSLKIQSWSVFEDELPQKQTKKKEGKQAAG